MAEGRYGLVPFWARSGPFGPFPIEEIDSFRAKRVNDQFLSNQNPSKGFAQGLTLCKFPLALNMTRKSKIRMHIYRA